MADSGNSSINWEAFYGNFRKPGYIAGFEILEKLGAGVFGLVYKARKESIGKLYAIKFLKVDEESVRDAVLRELDSVRYFAQVDHPNLVAIEDKGEVDGIPYIVMAYAGNSTLRKLLDAGDLSRDEALRIFVQISRGLQALHDRSLVHFDLKPANIYLKGEVARIGDYGLSKLISRSHNSLSFGRGTPHYMAPEMLTRHGDHRSDIYSLGILLYEMLVGRPPFKGDSEWEVLRKHETETPSYPADLDAGDRRVIERCLAKDPEQRLQSVGELLALLEGTAQVAPAHSSRAMPLRDAALPLHGRGSSGVLPRSKSRSHRRGQRSRHDGLHRLAAICMGVCLAFASLGILSNLVSHRSSVRYLASQSSRAAALIGTLSAPRVSARISSARNKRLLPFPENTGSRRQKELERKVLELRKRSTRLRNEVHKALQKIDECEAIPALVNQMARLNLRRVADANFAYRINEVLRDLTSIDIEFQKPRSKRSVDSRTAKRNTRSIQRWAEYYRDSHMRKASSRPRRGR